MVLSMEQLLDGMQGSVDDEERWYQVDISFVNIPCLAKDEYQFFKIPHYLCAAVAESPAAY